MKIEIAKIKAWREDIDATHLVVFAVGRDGSGGHSQYDRAHTPVMAGETCADFEPKC